MKSDNLQNLAPGEDDLGGLNRLGNQWGPLNLLAGVTAVILAWSVLPAGAQGLGQGPVMKQDGVSPFAGLYVGVHGGYAGADADFFGAPYVATLPPNANKDVPVSGRNDNFDPDGAMFGVHAGYSEVTNSNILFGIEGDWSHLNNDDTITGGETVDVGGENVILDHVSRLDLNWQASLRGRLGVIQDNTLFYGTIGIAFLDLDWSETATASDPDDTGETYVKTHKGSDTLTGLVLGGGVEIALTEDIFFGAEYLYENFGDSGGLPFGHSSPAQMGKIDLDMHKARLRLSFKLGE